MARSRKPERIDAVLEAAALRVRSAQVGWANSIVWTDLAQDTGIDHAQLVRDFGSKDDYARALTEFIVAEHIPPMYVVDADVDALPVGDIDSLVAVVADRVAARFLEQLPRTRQAVRSQMLVWATTVAGSTERRLLAQTQDERLKVQTATIARLTARLETSGGFVRSNVGDRELAVLVLTALDGLAVRSTTIPSLGEQSVAATTVRLLLAGRYGNDPDGPQDEQKRIQIT